MKTRCALKILFIIRAVFPKEKSIAQSILDELTKIVEMGDDIQKDIKTLAYRYHKNLIDLMPKMKDSKKLQGKPAESKSNQG